MPNWNCNFTAFGLLAEFSSTIIQGHLCQFGSCGRGIWRCCVHSAASARQEGVVVFGGNERCCWVVDLGHCVCVALTVPPELLLHSQTQVRLFNSGSSCSAPTIGLAFATHWSFHSDPHQFSCAVCCKPNFFSILSIFFIFFAFYAFLCILDECTSRFRQENPYPQIRTSVLNALSTSSDKSGLQKVNVSSISGKGYVRKFCDSIFSYIYYI